MSVVKDLIKQGASVEEIAAVLRANHPPKDPGEVTPSQTYEDVKRSVLEDPDGLRAWDAPEDISDLQQAVIRGTLTTQQYGEIVRLMAQPE